MSLISRCASSLQPELRELGAHKEPASFALRLLAIYGGIIKNTP